MPDVNENNLLNCFYVFLCVSSLTADTHRNHPNCCITTAALLSVVLNFPVHLRRYTRELDCAAFLKYDKFT